MLSPRITASLTYWSTRTPDTVAIECAGTTLTWRELADRVEALAAALAADGLRAGDRIGYLCQNGVGVIETILAAAALDAIVVPLNIRLTTRELAWIADDAGLDALLADTAYERQAAQLRDGRDLRVYWQGPGCPDWARPLGDEPTVPTAGRLKRTVGDPDVPAFISYTSGTTGRPKGAVLSHGNFLAAAISFATTESMTRHDSCLLVLPLAFTGSLMATWAPTYYTGARFVMHPRFDAARTLAELEHGSITVFPAVPVVFDQLAALPGFDTADLGTVRVAKAGGAPPSTATLARYVRRGMPIGQGYGMTESTGVGASLPQEDFERKAGSTGVPNYGIELSIMDDGKPLPANEVGEICLRGAAVMLGYWRRPEATAAAIRDGWLRTGDLGRLDAEGYLTIMGRAKDMVLSGGLNVYPGEIERVILLDPRVAEAAVVAVPDERWGEVPAAVVVTDSADVTAETVVRACRAELADYKIPRYVYVRPEPLPRTMSGKVAKADVRAEIVDREGRPA